MFEYPYLMFTLYHSTAVFSLMIDPLLCLPKAGRIPLRMQTLSRGLRYHVSGYKGCRQKIQFWYMDESYLKSYLHIVYLTIFCRYNANLIVEYLLQMGHVSLFTNYF